MKKLKITIDGHTYEVTVVEESGEKKAPAVVAARPEPAPRTQAKPAPKPAPAAATAAPSGKGHKVDAPLAGAIRSVVVKEGDRVAEGDLVLTLEALKLENEILAPVAGQVATVSVKPGDEVQAGQTLIVISA